MLRQRVFWFAIQPLSTFWLLILICVTGGIVEWLFLDRLPWEAWGAAAALAGITRIIAHAKGVAPWPWSHS